MNRGIEIGATASNCSFSENWCLNTGLTFHNPVINCSINDQIHESADIVGCTAATFEQCTFNSNRAECLRIDNTITDCTIADCVLNDKMELKSLVSGTTINGNRVINSIEIGATATDCTVSGNKAGTTLETSFSDNTNTVTGNKATSYPGWETFASSGYPNDLLDTGVVPIIAGVGLNRT